MPFKTFYITLLFILCSFMANAQDSTNTPIVDFSYVEKLLQAKNNDTVYVVNFWATWCKPCVKELPYITNLDKKYSDKKIKVFLVSLDFTKNHDKMIAFLKSKNISTPTVLLSAPDANAWIDKVDKSWSGSIPATVIFKNNRREFFEKDFEEEELYQTVATFF